MKPDLNAIKARAEKATQDIPALLAYIEELEDDLAHERQVLEVTMREREATGAELARALDEKDRK